MPSSERSFVTMYLAELNFANGYMEIDLFISNFHGIVVEHTQFKCTRLSQYGANAVRRRRRGIRRRLRSAVWL